MNQERTECNGCVPEHRREAARPASVRCAAWILFAILAVVSPACARVIAWPGLEPDADFVLRHIAAMETKPLDGVVLQATMAGQQGLARLFAWSAVSRKYSHEEFRPFVETLRQVPFHRFRHNFLRLNLNPTDRPFDMFDDEQWEILTENVAVAAAAAREAGLRGFMLDPEAYADPEPGTEIPRFNVFDFRLRRTPREFPAYRQQAFRRGQEVGRVAVSAYPGITLIFAFGPGATCLGRGILSERFYGLLGAFVDGVLAGAAGQATVVEGFELSYPYRSCDRFQTAYANLRGPCRDLSPDPARYDRWLEIGFGIWMDYDSASVCRGAQASGGPCRWFDPSLYPAERRDLVDPERFAQAVASARAVSDGYVWIYTEEPKWWTREHPFGENLPEAHLRALERGREATTLSCPRPIESPSTHSVPAGER